MTWTWAIWAEVINADCEPLLPHVREERLLYEEGGCKQGLGASLGVGLSY